MLLLVLDSKFNEASKLFVERVALKDINNVTIDVSTIVDDLLDRGPRDEAARRAGELRPEGVVVGIEQIGEIRIKRTITRDLQEYKGLKKPRRVADVPTDRAGVFHRLNDVILGCQRLA